MVSLVQMNVFTREDAALENCEWGKVRISAEEKTCSTHNLNMLRGQFLAQCHSQVTHRSRVRGISKTEAVSYASLSLKLSTVARPDQLSCSELNRRRLDDIHAANASYVSTNFSAK